MHVDFLPYREVTWVSSHRMAIRVPSQTARGLARAIPSLPLVTDAERAKCGGTVPTDFYSVLPLRFGGSLHLFAWLLSSRLLLTRRSATPNLWDVHIPDPTLPSHHSEAINHKGGFVKGLRQEIRQLVRRCDWQYQQSTISNE